MVSRRFIQIGKFGVVLAFFLEASTLPNTSERSLSLFSAPVSEMDLTIGSHCSLSLCKQLGMCLVCIIACIGLQYDEK